MKWGVVFVVLIVSLYGCKGQPRSVPVAELVHTQFLDNKQENGNIMKLYSVKGTFDLDEFRAICEKERDSQFTFSYIVLFDKSENAAFPVDPFTSEFGMEEKKLSHIKALYTFNSQNGFSELVYYDSNAWEGKATRIKL